MDCAVPVGAGLTRRRLLAAGAGGFAALAVGTVPAARARPTGDRLSTVLRRASFSGRVGQTFTLAGAGGTVRARLAKVDDFGAGRIRGLTGSDAAFVLIFHASSSATRLDQDVMAVRHPALGTFNLLVTPSGTGRRGQDYSAVIDTRS
jgi:hypothetical protein